MKLLNFQQHPKSQWLQIAAGITRMTTMINPCLKIVHDTKPDDDNGFWWVTCPKLGAN